MIECLQSTQILESNSSTKVLNEIKKSHMILKDHHKEIKSWLAKHNASGKQCKEEVSAIFEKLTKFCVLVEAKSDDQAELDDF